MNSRQPILEFESATKRFGQVAALQQLSLRLERGQTVILLGANGSGKSTLLRAAAGLTALDSGSVKVLAGSSGSSRPVGYYGHQSQLYSALTVTENLYFFASLNCGEAKSAKQITAELASNWQLEEYGGRRAGELSKGLQSRLSLACTMIGDPQLLLLDEPSSALDDAAVQVLKASLRAPSASGGSSRAILIATHDLARLRDCAERVVLLEDGSIRGDSAQLSAGDAIDKVIELYHCENR